MEYSEVYNKAADLVEKGWTQNAQAKTGGEAKCNFDDSCAVRWCLTGALMLAYYTLSSFGYSLTELRDYLGLGRSPSLWNDHPDRTQEEVVKLLRETAKRADEENKIIGE